MDFLLILLISFKSLFCFSGLIEGQCNKQCKGEKWRQKNMEQALQNCGKTSFARLILFYNIKLFVTVYYK